MPENQEADRNGARETLIVEEWAEVLVPPQTREKLAPAPTREAEDKKDDPDLEAPLFLRSLYELFSPLTAPTYITLFIFLLSILAVVAPGAALPYTLTVFGATFLVPLITMFVLLRIGAASSFYLWKRKERLSLYLVEILALGGVTIFFVFKGANPWMWSIFCGGAAAALANLIINSWMRVSCHCTAIAAILATFIVINNYGMPQTSLFWWVVGTLCMAGFVGTMAIVYGRHSIWEVLVGYATGFLGIMLFSLIH